VNFISRLLLKRALSKRQKMLVRCSGLDLHDKQVFGHCFKQIEAGKAIKLEYDIGNQHHELYFCSFPCLDSFRRWVSN
jgi:hypothetical protein